MVLDGLDDDTTPQEDIERLAKLYLLKLSQVISSPRIYLSANLRVEVCSWWHNVVMCTPSLWSTIVADTTLWPETSSDVRLGLVSAALNRSDSHSLRVEVAAVNTPDGIAVLELLSRHSSRWKTLNLWNGIPSVQAISSAKGNLPLLESAIISIRNNEWSDSIGVFGDAPLLTALTFTGWVAQLPLVPWDQLRQLRFINAVPGELAESLSLLSRFSTEVTCCLDLIVDDTFPLELPHLSSRIQDLTLKFELYGEEPIANDLIGSVLKSLTLPHLSSLSLRGDATKSPEPLVWNQAAFIPFALRSGLRDTLLRLNIDAHCAARDLLQCLVHLPLLQELVLVESDGVSSDLIISDELFVAFARVSESDQIIVPRLRFVALSSNLHFSDARFWSFVENRIWFILRDDALFDPDLMSFEVILHWRPSCVRLLTVEFHEHAAALLDSWAGKGFQDDFGTRQRMMVWQSLSLLCIEHNWCRG
ncbi:hypothetical protein FB45DRAFT_1052468 [Roridomyces roridus]|uniref:F-box domain-containing protein n=1 Tax=Roridomyces roridus TaxID=1738132 RepID=A0AAD7CGU1_9AGAR|nr:hypothetical protein FB45DRAFT_1052468 [Roridomyces roridus]